jgi:MFS family permease
MEPQSARPWLNATVVGFALSSLFSDLSHELVTSMLPAFLASMGASAAALGTIEGAADGLSSLAKVYGGWLADRVQNRKTVCAFGYAITGLSPLAIGAAVAWPIILAGRGVAWIARGIRSPSRKALLSEAVGPEARGRAFGFERAMDTVGAIAAPLTALALLSIGLQHRTIILLATAPALLPVILILLLVKETPNRTPTKRPFLKSFSGFSSEFKEFLVAVGVFGLGDFARSMYILYAVSVLTPQMGAIKAAAIGVAFYAFHNVLYAIWSYSGGWIADHSNRRFLLACGYAAGFFAVLLAAVGVQTYLGLGAMFGFAGTAVGIYDAVEDVIAADLLPQEIRGSGYGALAVVTGTGDLISSLSIGWLWTIFGSRIAFSAAAVLMLSGIALMLHLSTKVVRAAT